MLKNGKTGFRTSKAMQLALDTALGVGILKNKTRRRNESYYKVFG